MQSMGGYERNMKKCTRTRWLSFKERLQVVSAYHILSEPAILVVARIILISLLAKERTTKLEKKESLQIEMPQWMSDQRGTLDCETNTIASLLDSKKPRGGRFLCHLVLN